ncbi:MAG: LamG-like jellyroll fold domain-containing protein [Mariniphaga sp.]
MKKQPKKIINKPLEDNAITNGIQLDFAWGFAAIAFSFIVYGVVAMILQLLYHPDTTQATVYAQKVLLNYFPLNCQPEPLERMLFVAAVFTITLSLVLFYWLSKKLRQKIGNSYIPIIYIISLFVGFLLLAWFTVAGMMATDPFAGTNLNYQDNNVGTANWDFYFNCVLNLPSLQTQNCGTFMYNYIFIYGIVIFPILLLLFLYPFKVAEKVLRILNNVNKTLVYGFCAFIIVLIFFISAFRFPYTFYNKYDFNAVFYSVVQVYNGLPLLVDNFMNTYGLYPHFVVPLMKLMGGSIVSFTLIMALLLSACFIFLLYVLRQTVSNIYLILFSFCSIFFMCYMFQRLAVPYDSNFAMFPIRWILPFGLMFFGSIYLKHKTKWLYYFSFFIFALGFLWNPDFGMLCYASLLVFYIYLELDSKKLGIIIIRSLLHVATAATAMAITIGLYMVSIRFFYGIYPQFSMLFSSIGIFSVIGFNMLPLTTNPHPWMLIAFIYVVGLSYSAYRLIEKKHTYKSNMIFLITVTGIACFSYYQGRSHNWNLLAICFPAFILMAIFADELLQLGRKQRWFYLPFSFILFILGFSLFQTIYDFDRITELVNEEANKKEYLVEEQEIFNNSNFINRNSAEKEPVFILTRDYFQGLYFNLTKKISPINPGLGDLFLKSDNDRIVKWIKDNRRSKIFYDPEGFRTSDPRYYAYMTTYYRVNKSQGPHGSMVMLTRTEEQPNSAYLLKQDPQSLVHELFARDFDKRVAYSMGEKGKIKTGDQFSVEIIFKPGDMPTGEATKAQTLIFTIHENLGFGVQQMDTSRTSYLVCIGQDCMLCPVIPGKWNYIAFEINKNKLMVFANGKVVGESSKPTSYENSPENLYIGSIKNTGGFYFGDIREVKISNGPLIKQNVLDSWSLIKDKTDEPQL